MFMDLPNDLLKEIGFHLDTKSLRFFALTSKHNLSDMRSLLIKHQQALLRLPSINFLAGSSTTYCYTADTLYASGKHIWGNCHCSLINITIILLRH